LPSDLACQPGKSARLFSFIRIFKVLLRGAAFPVRKGGEIDSVPKSPQSRQIPAALQGQYRVTRRHKVPEAEPEWQENEMKVRTRFIKSVIETAKTENTRMPWVRGAQRIVHGSVQPPADSAQRFGTA
jgi:hypothetical protein